MTSNRERFEAWYLAEFWEGSNCGRAMLKKEHCGGYTYAKPQELWKVWQAAQPAAGEPAKSRHRQEMDELREARERSMAAPPAAAHGDEAVRKEFEAWFAEKAKTLPLLRGATCLRYHDGQGQYVNDWALFGYMAWARMAAKGVRCE